MNKAKAGKISNLSIAGLIITLGIVYGDIGTSPLYVMRAIASSARSIDTNFILGALSCIIWTLTLQTTVKYVLITLKADNKGEGGIYSLFALIRRKMPRAYIFAIIGGSTLLADGIITPAITVTSAVEGLQLIHKQLPVIPIVLVIITGLFIIQQFGTQKIGSSFGPIMATWFFTLAILGISQIIKMPLVFKAFNPYYAFLLISESPSALLVLGAVFLCITGCEALYSDLGHCGLKNIQISWIFVKSALILNYLGQGAFLLKYGFNGENPFFSIMPQWFVLPGIILATMAAIIASQALISGSFTLISVASSLNLWPNMKRKYPTTIKGQIYIPSINWFLFLGVLFVVLFFRESSNMEAAYGLSVNLTLISTTILVMFYLMNQKVNPYLIALFLFSFLVIEGTFLYANLLKFTHGGWLTLAIASGFFIVKYGWYNARKIRNRHISFTKITDYIPVIYDLSKDKGVPKYATNLVYMTRANNPEEIESKIIYSIINKQPKRADVYWFLHVDMLDDPDTFEYEVKEIIPGNLIRIDFRLGFKIEPRVNLYFHQVLDDMEAFNEIDLISRYDSLRKYHIDADFLFIMIDRVPNYDYEFSPYDKVMMELYTIFRRLGISEVKYLGLDTTNVVVEKVPLTTDRSYKRVIHRKINTDKE
jgi:KUP system potassium uptake protein